MKGVLAVVMLVGLAGLAGCVESPSAPIPRAGAPLATILDGAHGGYAHFYFLPPMVRAPQPTGTFDAALEPTVVICALTGGTCSETIAQFTLTSGTSGETLQLDAVNEAYYVNWHTGDFDLDPGAVYRVRVLVGTQELGFADIMVVASGSQLKDVDATKYVGVVNGRTVPVKFRIETGIPASVTVAPSAPTIVEQQTQAFTATVYDLHGTAMTCPQDIVWSSDKTAVATVASTGEATAVSEGTATITAACETASGSATLTVTPKLVTWAAMASGRTADLYDVYGSSGGNVLVSADSDWIVQYNGTSWSSVGGGKPGVHLWGIWAAGPTDAYAVGRYDVIYYYDGSAWWTRPNVAGVDNYGVWGLSASDVFVGGPGGRISHYDGTSWTLMTSPTPNFVSNFWGSSGSNVYAVGDNGQILHYDGSAWSTVTTGTGLDLYDIWGSSASDIYAVGQNGIIRHFDGTSWTTVVNGTTADNTLQDVWGTASDNVYVVGAGGRILHYDGTSWTPMTSGTTVTLNGIWGSSASDIFVVGMNGTILHGTK